jgi:RHS repeat-associated protein
MLRQVINPGGKSVVFSYDPLGRRIAKQYKGVVTRWVLDGNVPLHEWKYEGGFPSQSSIEKSGAITEIKEPVENLVTWVFEDGSFVPCAKIENEIEYSIVADYLGTPTHAYDSKGEKIWEREIDCYGKVRKLQGEKDFCPYLYQGQSVDIETGLAYNRFRYYDNESGSYLSQDPIGLMGGVNLYCYVNDPNAWIDIFGLAGKVNPVDLKTVNSVSRPSNADLVNRTSQIHDILPEASQGYKTTAVGYATDASGKGYLLVSSSDNHLSPTQRAALNPGNGEVYVSGKGHAEVTIADYARKNNLTVHSIAASRPICENCALRLSKDGIEPASPIKKTSKPHSH